MTESIAKKHGDYPSLLLQGDLFVVIVSGLLCQVCCDKLQTRSVMRMGNRLRSG